MRRFAETDCFVYGKTTNPGLLWQSEFAPRTGRSSGEEDPWTISLKSTEPGAGEEFLLQFCMRLA